MAEQKNPTLYDYLRQFHDVYETGILTDKAVVLYWQMVNMFNAYGWKKWAGVDTAQLMAMLHTTNKTTALRERDILVKSGLIEYKKGRKGKVSEYRLCYSNVTYPVTCNVTETELGNSNVTCNVTDNVTYPVTYPVTPHKTKDLRPKTEDVSPRKVSSRNETGILSEGCAEPPKAPPAPPPDPPVFQIPLNDNSFFDVMADMVEYWRNLYPAVDVEQEFRAMIGWCNSNRSKRKTRTGVEAFINRWLAKEQNRGGTRQGGYQGLPWDKLSKRGGGSAGTERKRTAAEMVAEMQRMGGDFGYGFDGSGGNC